MKPPPAWERLVAWAAPREDRDAILSDLHEEFLLLARSRGPRHAGRWYRGQVLRSLVPLVRLRIRAGARFGAGTSMGDLVGDLARDLRAAARVHGRTPLVSGVIILSLGLGIGASTSVFSFARSALFPGSGGVEDPETFVSLYTSDEEGGAYGTTSFPDFEDIRTSGVGLERVAAVRLGVVELHQHEETVRIIVELVTGEYFQVVGARPPLGRTFLPEETRMGDASRVVILGHDLWTRRYGADPDILGREIILDGAPFVVVGVAPESLRSRFLQLGVDAWIPLGIPGGTYHATESELTNRRDREYLVLGRAATGVLRDQLQAQLDGVAARLLAAYPGAWTDDRDQPRRLTVLTEAESRVPPPFRAAMGGLSLLLLAATGLVLLVACSNVAGLLLARAHARTREMAIRVSLGASRGRIVRMLLAEGLLLSAVGGGLGVLGAVWAARRFRSIPLPGDLPSLDLSVSVDWPVLSYAGAVAIGAALVFGLAPALEAVRSEVIRARWGGVGRAVRRSGVRRGLVALQVAGSVVFLAGAALVFRSMERVDAAGSGLDTGSLAVVSRQVPEEDLGRDPVDYFRELTDAALGDDRVDRVALASVVEGSPFFDLTLARIQVPGQPRIREVVYNAVSPEYPALVGLDVVSGRRLGASDTRGAPRVVMVNEPFARRFWPEGPAVGQRFTIVERRALSTPEDTVPVTVEVVGVVREVHHTPGSRGLPFFWAPMDQFPVRMAVLAAAGPSGPGAAALALRQRLPDREGQVSLVGPAPHVEVAALGTLGYRLAVRGLGLSAAFALGLALMGLAGLVSFTVSLRLPEIALRKALGAEPRSVVGEVIKGALAPVWKGMVLGLLMVIPLAYLGRGLLHGVSPLDPLALGGSLALLVLAAFGTSLAPALRAGRADPNRYLNDA